MRTGGPRPPKQSRETQCGHLAVLTQGPICDVRTESARVSYRMRNRRGSGASLWVTGTLRQT
jgi:hypothetical protein